MKWIIIAAVVAIGALTLALCAAASWADGQQDRDREDGDVA